LDKALECIERAIETRHKQAMMAPHLENKSRAHVIQHQTADDIYTLCIIELGKKNYKRVEEL
jgi:hypothetical protein